MGLDFHGVIHSLKAIKTARDTNLQKAMRSPFPCRKGGRGDRSIAAGGITSLRCGEELEEGASFVFRHVLRGDPILDDSLRSLGDWSRLASYSFSTLNSHCQLSVD